MIDLKIGAKFISINLEVLMWRGSGLAEQLKLHSGPGVAFSERMMLVFIEVSSISGVNP